MSASEAGRITRLTGPPETVEKLTANSLAGARVAVPGERARSPAAQAGAAERSRGVQKGGTGEKMRLHLPFYAS